MTAAQAREIAELRETLAAFGAVIQKETARARAEAVSIDDMVPGTSFWAKFRGTDRLALFVKAGGKTTWPIIDIAAGALATYTVRAIDEDTITLVSPPKENA